MGIVSRIGHWLDTRFPEKISADMVLAQMSEVSARYAFLEMKIEALEVLYSRVDVLEKKAAEQISEMNKAKVAFMSLRPQPSTFPHR